MLKTKLFTPQHDQMDCGSACLAMIAGSYGKKIIKTGVEFDNEKRNVRRWLSLS
jgi:ABC-type bacteriocin/lantibiotic exporter with double-glycine peptidase domain